MDTTNKLIPHLEEIQKIRDFEKIVLDETNVPVSDISHWNAGDDYKKLIFSKYYANTNIDFSDYHYSYEYLHNAQKEVITLLAGNSTCVYDCVLVQNSTSAICCIADYLKKHNYKRICILDPAYFSISSCLLSFGLNIYVESISINENDEINFPYENILNKKYDVVWITSPVFSTGIYFSEKQIEFINQLSQNGILLIIDESASAPHHTLTKQLTPTDNIISIFSPHKYLSINSIKFAAIICAHSVSAYIEDWIDVLVGSLPASSCIAINHYLSSNFTACLELHDKYIEENLNLVQKLCKTFPDNSFKGSGVLTNYITMCNDSLAGIKSLDDINMLKLMRHTHVSFIPGYINGFSDKWGFCYRLNLTLNSTTIQNSLGRLFNYFL